MSVKAILGPTNTGKTHLAIERMCAHSSGMIGFPLRLLAREVYDRVVRLKGERQVALITGEERILPQDARYYLCTAESMPLSKDLAFVAIDEAQLGSDPERGHVFTDRILNARGREETLILGSDRLRPMVRALVPDAEIVGRPRFSTLSYAGTVKLSRLPPRSVVVAFSADEVYAVAEMLRRFRGGAAVVMGALSPATRNAQVAMYQAGEVDYLVATDAIGMGLNLDVKHVAFAGLDKFDGRRQRRLSISEMAQIAGRAGRHQRDGSFGTLSLGGGRSPEFTPEEIEAIEAHRFGPLDFVYWRATQLDYASLGALVASLETRPDHPALRPAPEAVDLAVLKTLADDGEVAALARAAPAVRRLWAACGLPDFRKSGPHHHAVLVKRVFVHLAGGGHVPHAWFADQVQRLDQTGGDIETLADRMAGIRTWAYIAHRADWLADPEPSAARTRQVEGRLSDALHNALTQRFVDRRTAVLLRDLGAKGADALPFAVDESGEVSVAGEPIGRLDGFTFSVDPAAHHGDRKMLLAAGERRLGGVLAQRAAELAGGQDDCFSLLETPGDIAWNRIVVAKFAESPRLLRPGIKLAPPLVRLSAPLRQAIETRLAEWARRRIGTILAPLRVAEDGAGDMENCGPLRALLAQLVDAGGVAARADVHQSLALLDRDDRRRATRLGLRIGALDLFFPQLLKPEAMRWRLHLLSLRGGTVALQPNGAPVVAAGPGVGLAPAGYRPLAGQWLRVDLAERLAAHAHRTREGNPVDRALVTSLGLSEASLARLMRELGYRADEAGIWRWKGRRAPRPASAGPATGAFAALEGLRALV